MDHTFIAFLNLTPEAHILFASDSITEILGYEPEEVCGKSCFDFFHPLELPHARSNFDKSIGLDKAAKLYYIRVLSKDGRWITCEVCFTIVFDVVAACTSVYYHGERSRRRAAEGAQVRRIFSASPRDPRYHMLEHLSPSFQKPPADNEPRAALILNRFSRNLTVMFATNAVSSILGSSADEITGRSFYRYMQKRCLAGALKCLESAKANDSIAYLRFWSRDPREDWENDYTASDDGKDDLVSTASDSEGGGADLSSDMDVDDEIHNSPYLHADGDIMMENGPASGSSSDSTSDERKFSDTMSEARTAETPATSNSSLTARPLRGGPGSPTVPSHGGRRSPRLPSVEVEAVISCASDGLVVVLRRARPAVPRANHMATQPMTFENGLFAAPWGQQPIQPYMPPEQLHRFQAPLNPGHMPLRPEVEAAGGPPMDLLMSSIRDTAVFAWALCGINGNLATHSAGKPTGKSQPLVLPVWDPNAGNTIYQPPDNAASIRYERENRGKPRSLLPTPNPYPFPAYQAASSRAYQDFGAPTDSQPQQSRLDEQRYGAGTEWPMHQAPIENGPGGGRGNTNQLTSTQSQTHNTNDYNHNSNNTLYSPGQSIPHNENIGNMYEQQPPNHIYGNGNSSIITNGYQEAPTPDASMLPGAWPGPTPLGPVSNPLQNYQAPVTTASEGSGSHHVYDQRWQ